MTATPLRFACMVTLALLPIACGGDGPVAPTDTVASVEISGPTSVRQGDVYDVTAVALNEAGAELPGETVSFEFVPAGAGLVTDRGKLVVYSDAAFQLIARAGGRSAALTIETEPRGVSVGSLGLEVVGHGPEADRFTSDIWLNGPFAYLGSWSCRGPNPALAHCGNRLAVWNIMNPAVPVLVDSLFVDAQTVNDVKVSADGTLGAITHEGSSDGLNGITLLDLSDPGHPVPITRHTDGLGEGVHNVWFEGNHLYVVGDGSTGLHVLDVSDPQEPGLVFVREPETSFLHDVYVRDNLVFLAHWDDGLIVLDVSGGFPPPPSPPPPPPNAVFNSIGVPEVSRILTEGGQVHSVWYWPEAGYAFVGEESRVRPGTLHVVDLRDLANPREVATFSLPGDPPHNFWLDEERGILYVAWFSKGVRAIDVTGELLGELDKQGREYGSSVYGIPPDCTRDAAPTSTCAWSAMFENGLVYVSDYMSGLWILRPNF
ncbi:MAG: LVIVD repeat-containing protein [Gemmatimonadota bacterium]